MLSLKDLPEECLVRLAQDWLNPREQRHLAATCRHWQDSLFPPPLRVQICKLHPSAVAQEENVCCLGGELLVSPVEDDEEAEGRRLQAKARNIPPPLKATETLQCDRPYFFWKYDYSEEAPVILSRQLRQSLPPLEQNNNQGIGVPQPFRYRFTLGFQLGKYPNQYWKIMPLPDRYGNSPETKLAQEEAVTPDTPVELVVMGWNDRKGQVDSNSDVSVLQAKAKATHSGPPVWSWCTMEESTLEEEEEAAAAAAAAVPDENSNTALHRTRRRRPESKLFLRMHPSTTTTTSSSSSSTSLGNHGTTNHGMTLRSSRKRTLSGPTSTNSMSAITTTSNDSSNSQLIQTTLLDTFCTPDLNDRGAYLLYRPETWKCHLAPATHLMSPAAIARSQDPNTAASALPRTMRSSNGRSAVVDFSFWIRQGILYFRAFCLPFTLAIPLVQLDREYFVTGPQDLDNPSRPIAKLFDSYSARWGSIKYYLATAADVGEGCALNMETFLRGVTDHEDHQVEQLVLMEDQEPHETVVAITMKQETSRVDDSLVPDVPRDDSQRWKFFFSW